MHLNNIQKLLDRYFEGRSTLEEERELRRYFQQDELPEPLLPYAPLFRGLQQAGEDGLSEEFEERLHAALTDQPTVVGRKIALGTRLLRAAAIALLALAAWWLVPQPPDQQPQAAIDWSQYEPETAEEALRITQQALNRTSEALQEGKAATRQMKNLRAINTITQ